MSATQIVSKRELYVFATSYKNIVLLTNLINGFRNKIKVNLLAMNIEPIKNCKDLMCKVVVGNATNVFSEDNYLQQQEFQSYLKCLCIKFKKFKVVLVIPTVTTFSTADIFSRYLSLLYCNKINLILSFISQGYNISTSSQNSLSSYYFVVNKTSKAIDLLSKFNLNIRQNTCIDNTNVYRYVFKNKCECKGKCVCKKSSSSSSSSSSSFSSSSSSSSSSCSLSNPHQSPVCKKGKCSINSTVSCKNCVTLHSSSSDCGCR